MSKEGKFRVERKIVEVLGELYGKYKQRSALEEEEIDWLK